MTIPAAERLLHDLTVRALNVSTVDDLPALARPIAVLQRALLGQVVARFPGYRESLDGPIAEVERVAAGAVAYLPAVFGSLQMASELWGDHDAERARALARTIHHGHTLLTSAMRRALEGEAVVSNASVVFCAEQFVRDGLAQAAQGADAADALAQRALAA